MDFAELRAKAIDIAREQLRAPLTKDEVLVHAFRCMINAPDALEHWLFAIFPQTEPNAARELVREKGKQAFDGNGIGATMDDKGWESLILVCNGKQPKIDLLAKHAAPNMHALLGAQATAEIVDAAGSLMLLSRMTQRDCMMLGNHPGVFGANPTDSILFKHELAKTERSLRVLSSRTVLAARLDVYSGNFKGESLRQEVLYAQ